MTTQPLPELKAGDRIRTGDTVWTVAQVRRGTDYDEPRFVMRSERFQIVLTGLYTTEKLSGMGFVFEDADYFATQELEDAFKAGQP